MRDVAEIKSEVSKKDTDEDVKDSSDVKQDPVPEEKEKEDVEMEVDEEKKVEDLQMDVEEVKDLDEKSEDKEKKEEDVEVSY